MKTQQKVIENVLEEVRPMLERDGGGVEYISLEDGVLRLRLLGACRGCPMSSLTFGVVVEQKLRDAYGDWLKEIKYQEDMEQEDFIHHGK